MPRSSNRRRDEYASKDQLEMDSNHSLKNQGREMQEFSNPIAALKWKMAFAQRKGFIDNLNPVEFQQFDFYVDYPWYAG